MSTFIGCTEVKQEDSPYNNYTKEDMVLVILESYGQIHGSHHKAWVIDQIARILKGAPISFFKREWTGHEPEYHFEVGESDEYHEWVQQMRFPDGEDGEEYDYDEGIAP